MTPDLGQFYTRSVYGQVLVNALSSVKPSSILDLGAGHGSLTLAAQVRFGKCQYNTVEIDLSNVSRLKAALPNAKHWHADALDFNLPTELGLENKTVDVAISNPPFIAAVGARLPDLLTLADMPQDWPELFAKRAEILFLAQKLRMLKPGGELGLILPDSLISGHAYHPFREWLFSSLTVDWIIELPQRAFTATDARAYVVTARRVLPSQNHFVNLAIASQTTELSGVLRKNGHTLWERCDPSFHFWQARRHNASLGTLAQLGVTAFRGLPVKSLRERGSTFFHSTDFKNLTANHMVKAKGAKNTSHMAYAGDILVPRVGRNCSRYCAFVQTGAVLISDCVLSLRVPKSFQDLVWRSIQSPLGKEWRSAHMRGVGASMLRQDDLLRMPLFALNDFTK